jgi:HEAT repeat protein
MTSVPDGLKEKSVSELFAQTLDGNYDDDAPWDAVSVLRLMGTPEVFQMAVEFCKSDNPLKRARAIDVLGQLGRSGKGEGLYFDERVEIVLSHLSDKAERVVESAAWSLSHMRGEKAVNGLLSVRQSTNAHVRHAVAAGLLGETSPEAVEALIALMRDVDDDVRDYATWSLGSEPINGTPVDSPAIRQAFRERLTDTFEDARLEAIWGLAIRKDPDGLKILLERVEADEWASGDQEAAAYLLGLPYDTPIEDLRDGVRKVLSEIICPKP